METQIKIMVLMKQIIISLFLLLLPLQLLSQNAFGSIGAKIPVEYMRNGKSVFIAEGTVVAKDILQDGKLAIEYVDILFRNDMDAPYGRPMRTDLIDLEFYGVTGTPNVFVHLCTDQIWKMGDYLISIPLSPWNSELLKEVKRIRVDTKHSNESKKSIQSEKERKEMFFQTHPSLL